MPYPKLMCVAGARPNFVKISPILKAFEARKAPVTVQFIHTGQHYNSDLDAGFFQALQIRQPDENLSVGSGSHAAQTALIMQRFEPILERYQPDALLVVGDINSTLACSLVAIKKNIPVVHVEAGLRSFDDSMPEEINRKLTDQISALHFVTEHTAKSNLLKEGIAECKIHFVGNVMIDSLMQCLPRVQTAETILTEQLDLPGLVGRPFGLVTLHRPSNVDSPETLETILNALATIAKEITLLFPMHPRTQAKLAEFKLERLFDRRHLIQIKPFNYLDMLGLMRHARIVLTDSGGIQEETTVLKVPCLTLRENTERPVTIEKGTNRLVGIKPEHVINAARAVLSSQTVLTAMPPLWDGHAAERIVDVLVPWLQDLAKAASLSDASRQDKEKAVVLR